MIISVCGECFNIDVRIYGTLLILGFVCVCVVVFFVILILMYAFILLVLLLLLLVVKRILMLITYSAASL